MGNLAEPTPDQESLFFRFWDKVTIGDDCWEWQAYRIPPPSGYGQFGMGGRRGRMHPAHRVAWLLWHGTIPEGMRVLHRCDNPPCVRPDHLFLGTQADNVRDMHQKGRYRGGFTTEARHLGLLALVAKARAKTSCPQGHLYDGANTYTSKEGKRHCRRCRAEKERQRRARRRESAEGN